jgi:hypothetical protein
MKKITTIIGLLLLLSTTPVVAADSSVKEGKNVENKECLRSAVSERENTLRLAFSEFTTAQASAYYNRGPALISAYDAHTSVKDIKAAVKAAWAEYRNASKTAYKEWRKDRSDAWKVFKTSAKNCKGTSEVSDVANLKEDVGI